MEMNTILVPVDFTPCANNALRYAIKMAGTTQSKLVLLHTYDIPATYGEVMASSVLGDMAQGVESGIKKSFEDLKSEIPELEEANYETIVKLSPLAETVAALAETNSISMIVVGTKGASGLKELVVGSNTYDIVMEAQCPVVVVPENTTRFSLKKIALACDYKKLDPQSLAPLKAVVKAFGAELHILHVSDEQSLPPDKMEEAKKFEPILKDIQHHYHLIINEDVEKGLESYDQEHDLDMLVVIPRKHGFLERIFSGSESKKIIFHTKIPLMALTEE